MIGQSAPRAGGRLVIVATFAIALILMAVPLPAWAIPFRPDWLGLVLIYWCLATPHLVGVGSGCVAGLLLDILEGSLLGQNALAKSVLAFLAVTFHLRVRMYPLWQQALVVLGLVLINQLLVVVIRGVIGNLTGSWEHLLPSLTSMLIWPWLFIILRDLRRYAQIR
jgi:rod shape-determining protein MreD